MLQDTCEGNVMPYLTPLWRKVESVRFNQDKQLLAVDDKKAPAFVQRAVTMIIEKGHQTMLKDSIRANISSAPLHLYRYARPSERSCWLMRPRISHQVKTA